MFFGLCVFMATVFANNPQDKSPQAQLVEARELWQKVATAAGKERNALCERILELCRAVREHSSASETEKDDANRLFADARKTITLGGSASGGSSSSNTSSGGSQSHASSGSSSSNPSSGGSQSRASSGSSSSSAITKSEEDLYKAVNDGDVRKVASLLKKGGVNVDALIEPNFTPLIRAVNKKNAEIVKLLLYANANINRSNRFGHTPLIYAVLINSSEMVKLLIEQKADINVRGPSNLTALMLAVMDNKIEIIKLLLAA